MKKTPQAKAWPGSESLDYVKRFAPALIEQRASLLPFENVICGGSAGPQPNCKHDDMSEEQHFMIEVPHPQSPELHYWITVKASGVTVELIQWQDGELSMREDYGAITMPQLWDFLRQLPRDLRAFMP
jgi:hypothetical protein